MTRRRLIVVLLVVAIVILLGSAEGVRRYASTRLVPTLASMYGGRVEADQARAGWTHSTLEGVRFYEADGEHVLLTVQRMDLDLTLWDLVVGRTMPDHLTLEQPQLALRFDESGNNLSQLPEADLADGTYPQLIDITQGSLTIEQQGRATTRIEGANVQITSDDHALVAEGQVENELWGNWKFAGQLDPVAREGTISAATQALNVTPEWLQQLPLVPPATWKRFTVAGPIDARLDLKFGPEPQGIDLHADLTTSHATATLPELGVTIQDAAAKISLDNTIATLTEVRGTLADGTVTGSGTIDFGADPLHVALDVDLRDVEISQLPANWSVPEETSGRLTGSAKLQVDVPNEGPIAATGIGKATLSQAVVGGIPVEPIELDLSEAGEQSPGAALSGVMTFNVNLRDAPLRPLLQRFGKLTESDTPDVEGLISTDLRVSIPLATVKDLATYRVEGEIDSPRLSWQGFELEDSQAQLDFTQGVLRLNELTARIPGDEQQESGSLSGSVQVDVVPLGELSLKLKVDHAPLELLSRFEDLELSPSGSASIDLEAQAPVDELQEVSAWQSSGRLSIPTARLGQRVVRNVSADFRAEQGTLHLSQVRAAALDTVVTGSAEVQLEAPYRYRSNFSLPQVELTDLLNFADVQLSERVQVFKPVAGQVQVAGNARGSLRPFTWDAAGTASATDMQLRNWIIEQTSFGWSASPEVVRLTQLEAEIFGGRVQGDVTLPLREDLQLQATGDFQRIRLEQLVAEGLGSDLHATGLLSGKFSLSGKTAQDLSGELQLESDRMEIEGVDAGEIRGGGTLRDGALEYHVGGEVLDGQFTVQGEAKLEPDFWESLRGSGRMILKRIQLAQAVKLLGIREPLPLEGMADLELEYAHSGDADGLTGDGRLVLTDVRWDRRDVVSQLEAQVFLADGRLRMPNISGRFAEGIMRASVSLALQRELSGEFTLALDRARADLLLAVWPELAEQVDGLVGARLRGSIGRRIAGGGAIGSSQLTVAGVNLSGMRLPVRFLYTPVNGRGEIQIQNSTVRAAQGRVTGGAKINWDREVAVAGQLQLVDLELRSLARNASSSVGVGSGRISGHTKFSAKRFRSLNDLNAEFAFTFAQAQASQMPIISTLSRYVLPTVPSSASFQQGELEGRLAGGIANIQRFTLTGNDTRLQADGTITLQGRLNLDVIALTGGNPVSRGLIRRVALPIIEAQTVPLTLLTRANTLLADRLIYLRVSGTVQSPSIQVQPAPQLRYEALRFFLGGAIAPVR